MRTIQFVLVCVLLGAAYVAYRVRNRSTQH